MLLIVSLHNHDVVLVSEQAKLRKSHNLYTIIDSYKGGFYLFRLLAYRYLWWQWCNSVYTVPIATAAMFEVRCGNSSSVTYAYLQTVVSGIIQRYTRILQIGPDSGIWIYKFWHFNSHATKNTSNMAAKFYAEFSGVTFASFFSLLHRFRCLHGRWSCWRRSVSFPSGYRSSARSFAHVDALLSRGRSSACCCLAPICTSSSPTTSTSLYRKVEISQTPICLVASTTSLSRSSSNLARCLLYPTENHFVVVVSGSCPDLFPGLASCHYNFIVIRWRLTWFKPLV